MATNVTYCLDDNGQAKPCVKVYDGETLIIHTEIDYPYESIPTSDIVNLVGDAKTLFNAALSSASAVCASDGEMSSEIFNLQLIGNQIVQLMKIRNSRSDYTP